MQKEVNGLIRVIFYLLLSILIISFLPQISASPANPGHAASSISAGQFESGNYTFPDSLHIERFLNVTGLLYVDPVNNRVGIGTTSPTQELNVIGDLNVTEGVNLSMYTSCTALETDSSGNLICGSDDTGVGGSESPFKNDTTEITPTTSVAASNLNFTFDSGTLFVDPTTDRVGIGTTSPSEKLDVSGNINIVGGLTLTGAIYNGDGIWSTSYGPRSDTSILFKNWNGNDLVTISNSGNVGIGTTSPGELLEVSNGNIEIGPSYMVGSRDGFSVGGSTGQIKFGIEKDSNFQRFTGIEVEEVNGGGGNLHGTLRFFTDSENVDYSTERMTITGTGNVGIGTTNPAFKLQVEGDINASSGGILQNATSCNSLDTDANGLIICGTDEGESGYDPTNIAFTNESNTFLESQTISKNLTVSDSLSVAKIIEGAGNFIVDASGNVGIGTTTPTQKLTVDNGRIELRSGNMLMLRNAANNYDFDIQQVDYTLQFGSASMGNVAMTYDLNGNVGIGTTSPKNKLEVAGTINATAIKVGVTDVCQEDGTNCPAGATGKDQWGWTNESGKVYTTQTGDKVGIGTTSPGAKLHVSGNTRIGDSTQTSQAGQLDVNVGGWNNIPKIAFNQTDANPEIRMYRPTGNAGNTDESYNYYITRSTSGLEFQKGGNIDIGSETVATQVIFDNSGNVGIGTTSPKNKLEVAGTINATAIKVGTTDVCQQDGTNCPAGATGKDQWGWTNESGKVYTTQTGDDVGIGTNNPNKGGTAGNALTIGGTILSNPELELWHPSDSLADEGYVGSLSWYAGSSATRVAVIDALTEGASEDAGQIRFRTATGGSLSEQMRIDSSGNVGIGTTAPDAKLNVNGGNLHIDSGNLNVYNDGGGVFIRATDGTLGAQIKESGISFINGGNVGIGTTNPLWPLHLNASGSDKFFKVESSDTYTGILLDPGADAVVWAMMAGYPGSSDFNIREYGVADRLVIKKTTGNVGIGTTSPLSKLEISGTGETSTAIVSTGGAYKPQLILQRGTLTDDYVDWKMHSTSANFYIDTSRSSVDTNRFFINYNTGNVGIGTTSPQNKLEVAGTINATAIKVGTTDVCQQDGTNCPAGATGKDQWGWTNESGKVYTTQTGDKVGIGTTNPDHILTVQKDGAAVTGLHIRNDDATDLRYSDLLFTYGVGDAPAGIRVIAANPGVNHNVDMQLFTNVGSTKTPRITIKSAGNVGIGETSPLARLEVLSSGSGNQVRIHDSSWPDDEFVGYGIYGAAQSSELAAFGYRYHIGGSGNSGIQLGTSSSALMTILTGGNVGIGTTAPSKKLEVVGDAAVGALNATSITSTGTIDTSGTVDAGEFTEDGSNTLSNDISGNAATATALAANGANCAAGHYPLGVDASGAVESCTADSTGNDAAYDPTNIAFLNESALNDTYIEEIEIDTIAELNIKVADEEVLWGGTLTSGKWCVADGTSGEIDCNVEPVTDTDTHGQWGWTNESGKVYTTQSGDNVGIGTTSPGEKLEVGGDVYITGAGGTIGAATLANGWLKLGTTLAMDDNEIMFGTLGYIGTVGANDLAFIINSGEKMRILSDGKVGIGTSAPSKKFEVAGDAAVHALNATTVNTGHGANELYAMDQDVETTDGVTFATVNTGQGAQELYGMAKDLVAGNGLTGGGDDTLYGPDGDVNLAVGGGTCITANANDVAVTNDCIGDTQLAYNTGQHLTTSSSPTFTDLTLSGDLAVNGDNINCDGDLTVTASGGNVIIKLG